MRVWRICKQRFAATAFSGEGARLFSGRWHPAGVSMVYTASSLALATVEVFVNLEPLAIPDDLVSIAAELPVQEDACEHVGIGSLPADWRRVDHPALQALGAAWARSRRSLALVVPSAAVLGEWNVLVNPEHLEAKDIRVMQVEPFQFDERMFRR